MKIRAGLLVFTLLLAACGGDGRHKAVEGAGASAGGGGGSEKAGGAPGFAQVTAVFKKNCTACHPSKQPADWLDYSTAEALRRQWFAGSARGRRKVDARPG